MQVLAGNKISFFQQLIQKELQLFSEMQLPANPARLYGAVKHTLTFGGKRARPLSVLLACDLFGGDIKKAIPAALAVELFHNFTLVHDDIMDGAPLRRNVSTVHKKWNLNVAILSGDAMLVKAYQLLNRIDVKNRNEILDIFSSVALKVCEGQQLDMDFEETKQVSISDYLLMIEMKTAVLLAGSFKIGALIAGASEKDAEKIYNFGKNIGIAFQLKDDILDVYGEVEKFGKQKGGDILSNKKTFLLLRSLELSGQDKGIYNELEKWMNAVDFDAGEKIKGVIKIYNTLGVRDIAEKEQATFYEKACGYLSDISADAEKKKQLILFAEGLMKREI